MLSLAGPLCAGAALRSITGCKGSLASVPKPILVPLLLSRNQVEAYMKYVFGLSAAALAVPFLLHVDIGGKGGS